MTVPLGEAACAALLIASTKVKRLNRARSRMDSEPFAAGAREMRRIILGFPNGSKRVRPNEGAYCGVYPLGKLIVD